MPAAAMVLRRCQEHVVRHQRVMMTGGSGNATLLQSYTLRCIACFIALLGYFAGKSPLLYTPGI